jgi:hypothetical protein
LLLALLLAGSMWFYARQVLVAYQLAEAAAYNRPRGNLSDLYPRWLGARELLLNHRDPYSPELTREIQAGYYGRELDPARPGDPRDQQGFVYPVYVVFLLGPLVRLPFPVVQTGFRCLLVVLTAASVLLWLRALNWRPPAATTAILVVLTLGSFPTVQGIELQQLSLVVSGMIAGGAVLLAGDHFLLAGVVLALATIKPQLALPMLAWLILWAASDFRKRAGLLWGFGLTMAILLAGAQYVLPGWMGRFCGAVSAYRQYTDGAPSLLGVLITPVWARILTTLIALALVGVCWLARREPANTPAFAVVSALVLAVTVVVIPTFGPYNQLLLLPGVLLIISNRTTLWNRSVLTRAACVIAGPVFFWPWLAALALTVASFVLPGQSVKQAWVMPLWTILYVPFTVLLLLGLVVAITFHDRGKGRPAVNYQAG